MELYHRKSLIWITVFLSSLSLINVEGRVQSHRKQVSRNNSSNEAFQIHVYDDTKDSEDSTSGQGVFDVMSFGAVGDGFADDTDAFREAWTEACQVESGVLLAAENYSFMITSTVFTGPCKPGLTFQLDGVLMPPEGPDHWPESDSRSQWLVFYRVDNMTLSGKGTIEGKGEQWWELPCKPHRGPNGTTLPEPCTSPSLLQFFMSSNVTVHGLNIRNSPEIHIIFDYCREVLIEKLSITSPARSPNTDGIHIENTKSVSIYNSNIANGDDCISIGAGCSDVDIMNISCTYSHGISIGSLGHQNSQACVSNITVRSTSLNKSDNGVRIKTWQGGTGSVTGVTFQDIIMENVRNCIIVDQYYCLTEDCRNQTRAININDVSYKNIKGTYNVLTNPIKFACSDFVPCVDIKLSDIELLPAIGESVGDPFCWNAYGSLLTPTVPPIDCLKEGTPQPISARFIYDC